MAKKEKTPLTPTQRKNKYKRISRFCFLGEFLSVMSPFIIIGFVNYDKYFVQYSGTKMSIAAMLSAIIMGIAIWLVSSKKFNNSFIALMIGWAVIDAIFFLLGEIISDIAVIMLFGFIGILGAFGLDIASQKFKVKAATIDDAIKTAEKENLVDEYKEELNDKEEKKTYKAKVKK